MALLSDVSNNNNKKEELNEEEDKGGWAVALHHCPHIEKGVRIPSQDTRNEKQPQLSEEVLNCSVADCQCTENWFCLKCHLILCGRYGKQHMLEHFRQDSEHCIAMAIGDLSFWCYKCDSYLDHLSISAIFRFYEWAHQSKFGYGVPTDLHKECKFNEHELFMKYLKEGRQETIKEETEEEAQETNEQKDDKKEEKENKKNKDNDKSPSNAEESKPQKNKRDPTTNPLGGRRVGNTSGPATAISDSEITEYFDEESELAKKARLVARLIQSSQKCVVYTGAGISTSAQIPDYRGPQGVWTLRAKGLQPTFKIELEQALPTFGHYFLTHLIEQKKIDHVVSTNVDGLHLRSGLSHDHLTELHGNIYLEYCSKCGTEYLRPFDVTKYRSQKKKKGTRLTGRLCEISTCQAPLRDSIIGFGEDLPEHLLKTALQKSQQADLVIVVGSSMRVSPASLLPSLSYQNRGVFVLVNLQKTKYDHLSHVRVFDRSDNFFQLLAQEMNITVPQSNPQTLTEKLQSDCQNMIFDPQF